ncbi:MAG: HAMP domain-containing protein [Candidatus Omnitrophota bacterium]
MKPHFLRRKYFIHPSSQLRYIALSVLPAMIISVFFVIMIVDNGEAILKKEKSKLYKDLYSLGKTVYSIEQKINLHESSVEFTILRNSLLAFQNTLKKSYYETLREWNRSQMVLFSVLPLILIVVALFALINSHRIAGPLSRITKVISRIADGKDTASPIHFRPHDEFKELAEAVEKLRIKLKDSGFLT